MSNFDSAPCPKNSVPVGDVSADVVSAQLSRVMSSRTFANAPVLRQLLEHLVTRTISGGADQLKEYALGIDVFNRGASFDPRADTIVRVQARRLRAKLAEYYDDEGRVDTVVIGLPKGHYVPTFCHADRAPEVAANEKAAPNHSISGRWVVFASILLTGAAMVFLLSGRAEPTASGSGPDNTDTVTAADDVPTRGTLRVVVTPFQNLTGDASLDTIGRRVADQVITALATLEGAAVAAQPSAPDDKDVPADVVVAGTYHRVADTVEFQARLVERRTGQLLHGFTISAMPELATTLEALQQTIAGAIAVHQDDFFGGLDIVSHPPTLEAYREYRAGLETFQSDYTRAMSHLQRAHELAPRFLPPMVVMVFAHGNLGQRDKSENLVAEMESISEHLTSTERLLVEFLRSNRQGRRGQAQRVLEQLAQLMPTSLLINHNLIESYVLTNRPQAAVMTYRRQPSISKALRHSIESYRRIRYLDALHMLGDYARELDESRRAQADAPGVLLYIQFEARALIALGRRAELDDIIERSRSLPRTVGWLETPGKVMEQSARELLAHGSREASLAMAAKSVEWYRSRATHLQAQREHREGLARACYLAENWHEAAALWEALVKDYPTDVEYRAWLAQSVAHTRDVQRARTLSSELERQTQSAQWGWTTYARATVAAILGEREHALELLRDAFTEGLPHGPHLHQNADFESLRDYEPYRRLLRPVG